MVCSPTRFVIPRRDLFWAVINQSCSSSKKMKFEFLRSHAVNHQTHSLPCMAVAIPRCIVTINCLGNCMVL